MQKTDILIAQKFYKVDYNEVCKKDYGGQQHPHKKYTHGGEWSAKIMIICSTYFLQLQG